MDSNLKIQICMQGFDNVKFYISILLLSMFKILIIVVLFIRIANLNQLKN